MQPPTVPDFDISRAMLVVAYILFWLSMAYCAYRFIPEPAKHDEGPEIDEKEL